MRASGSFAAAVACNLLTAGSPTGAAAAAAAAFAPSPVFPSSSSPAVGRFLSPFARSAFSFANGKAPARRSRRRRSAAVVALHAASDDTASVRSPAAPPPATVDLRSWSESHGNIPSLDSVGLYRPFAAYAWHRIVESGLYDTHHTHGQHPVPEDLRRNSSPARGMPEGSTVDIEVRSAAGLGWGGDCDGDGGGAASPSRLARYALLETLTPEPSDDGEEDYDDEREAAASTGRMVCAPSAIHVLNLVIFPSPDLCSVLEEGEEEEAEEEEELALPVLGIDLVTLPGGKHLVAIDFQPVRPLPESPNAEQGGNGDDNEDEDAVSRAAAASPPPRRVLPPRYSDFESRLSSLHSKYCGDPSTTVLPWGGDIPSAAARYFSPYAVWTRLAGPEGLETVRGEVWEVFCGYVDLYLDLMDAVRSDVKAGVVKSGGGCGAEAADGALEGQRSYLNYRRVNDPARPMLRSLYGEEWTERLIEEVLFEDI